MTFFLISKKGSSKFLSLLGRTGGIGLFRITLLIFVYLTLHSTIFFPHGWADEFLKAIRHAHDISNLKFPSTNIYLRIIYLGEKSVLHNMIRDEIYRFLERGNLHYRLESNHLLPDSPGHRPADILMIPIALYRQSIWGLMSRITLDISIISPFWSSNLGQGNLSAAKSQAERKYRDRDTAQRYHIQDIGVESLIFEDFGDLESEGNRLLLSLCRAFDENLYRNTGSIYQK